jgi:SAM-dependent methyltransferase
MSRTPFDAAAPVYDEEFESAPATSRLRSIVSSLVLGVVRPGDHLLEINCGTGTDAVDLGSRGLCVLATDASPRMIEATREKIRLRNLEHTVEPLLLPFERLRELDGRVFDGVLSNMGGLNCAQTLSPVAGDLGRLVRSGGHAVLCLLSPFCLWETAAFLLRGCWNDAFRRRTGRPLRVVVHGEAIDVYYHSPSSVVRSFSPWFHHVRTCGLNILSPPPSSRRAYERLGEARRVLEWLDDRLWDVYPFSHMGDHVVIVLKRRAD